MLATALIALVAACDRKETAPAPAATAEPHGWRVAGKAIDTAAVLALGSEGETSLRVTVATGALDCDKLRAAYPEHPQSGTVVDLWFAQPMKPDGSREPWSFRSAFALDGQGGRSLVARGAMVEDLAVSGDAVVAKGLELALQDRGGEKGQLFQYEGDLRAKLCGRATRKEPDRPQPKLKVTVAGQPLEVHGASVRPEGKKFYLRLTHAPHKCDSAFTEGYDYYLDVALAGDPPKVELAALLGDVFPDSATGSKGKDAFEVKPDGSLAGTGEVTIALKGNLDAGGYPLAFDGEVSALRCTPAK